jgi:hypothetical protein
VPERIYAIEKMTQAVQRAGPRCLHARFLKSSSRPIICE